MIDARIRAVIAASPAEVQPILERHYAGVPVEHVLRFIVKLTDSQGVCISSPGRYLAQIVEDFERRWVEADGS